MFEDITPSAAPVLVEGLQVLQEGAPVEDLLGCVPIGFLLQQNVHSLNAERHFEG